MVGDPVTEGVIEVDSEELGDWVGLRVAVALPDAVTDNEGLGVDEIGGEGEARLTMPEKW